MKYQKLLCEKCKEKIRKEWRKEKKAYRLKIKLVGKNKKQKVKINHEKINHRTQQKGR